jgi:hypothetical protein
MLIALTQRALRLVGLAESISHEAVAQAVSAFDLYGENVHVISAAARLGASDTDRRRGKALR